MGRAGYPLIDGAHQRRFGDAGDELQSRMPGTRYPVQAASLPAQVPSRTVRSTSRSDGQFS